MTSIFLSPNSVSSAAAAKSPQSCPTLCDPIDSSLPGSPVPGNLQARTLEWIAISFSNAWKWKVKVKSLSRVQLLATPWTAAHRAPPSMGFSRQEYRSGVPVPFPLSALILQYFNRYFLPYSCHLCLSSGIVSTELFHLFLKLVFSSSRPTPPPLPLELPL